jgi:hypothetical protein
MVNGKLTAWKAIVTINVWMGLMFGSTAKIVSPTRPREVEATPATFTAMSKPIRLMSNKKGRGLHLGALFSQHVDDTHIAIIHGQQQ